MTPEADPAELDSDIAEADTRTNAVFNPAIHDVYMVMAQVRAPSSDHQVHMDVLRDRVSKQPFCWQPHAGTWFVGAKDHDASSLWGELTVPGHQPQGLDAPDRVLVVPIDPTASVIEPVPDEPTASMPYLPKWAVEHKPTLLISYQRESPSIAAYLKKEKKDTGLESERVARSTWLVERRVTPQAFLDQLWKAGTIRQQDDVVVIPVDDPRARLLPPDRPARDGPCIDTKHTRGLLVICTHHTTTMETWVKQRFDVWWHNHDRAWLLRPRRPEPPQDPEFAQRELEQIQRELVRHLTCGGPGPGDLPVVELPDKAVILGYPLPSKTSTLFGYPSVPNWVRIALRQPEVVGAAPTTVREGLSVC